MNIDIILSSEFPSLLISHAFFRVYVLHHANCSNLTGMSWINKFPNIGDHILHMLPDLQWFLPQAFSALCPDQATAKGGTHAIKNEKKPWIKKTNIIIWDVQQIKSQINKVIEYTTHPEPCKAAPSAFIFWTNASTEPNCVPIAPPREPFGGSPPPAWKRF